MNGAEKIKAAIDKLARLRDDSTPGPWNHWPEAGDVEITGPLQDYPETIIANAIRPRNGWGGLIYEDDYEPNAELITTLHRTIDAQLVILWNALHRHLYASISIAAEVKLAESILGDQ